MNTDSLNRITALNELADAQGHFQGALDTLRRDMTAASLDTFCARINDLLAAFARQRWAAADSPLIEHIEKYAEHCEQSKPLLARRLFVPEVTAIIREYEATRPVTHSGNNELREALMPFAALAEQVDAHRHEDDSTCAWRLKALDIRRARAALSATKPAAPGGYHVCMGPLEESGDAFTCGICGRRCGRDGKPAAQGELERNVLIGDNHLASALISISDPLLVKDYDDALHTHGQPYADMWVAWKRIMEWRDGVLEQGWQS